MIKHTKQVGNYTITILLFENGTSKQNFIAELEEKGFTPASDDEKTEPNTYHVCFNDLGVIYYDLV